MKITILSFYDRISLFHSLKPFLFSRHSGLFDFTRDPRYCLTRDRNRVLFMDRWFLKPDRVDLDLLARLRDKYRTIFFFNGNAGGGILRPEVLPFVDLFFNKSLFKDRSIYTRTLYGDELFTEHYHADHGIEDPEPIKRQAVTDPALLDKLRVSWNIGIGDFPKLKYRQRLAVALARMTNARAAKPFHKSRSLPAEFPVNEGICDIHARWGGPKRPTLLYHRTILLDRIRDNPRFLVGKVPQNQYNREIRHAKITLSPFGWGEVCFRDFEAVLNGSLLLKPDMGHLETWPNAFVPGETYVPFSWDGEDLVEKGTYYLENEAERRRIAGNAFDAYVEQARGLDERLESILHLVRDF